LVTGAAGFIGSHLAETLVQRGVEVVCMDDMSAGKAENLDPIRSSPLFYEVVGDVTDQDAVREAMRGVDTVFHQAASKKTVCMRDPRRDLDVNAGGALRLLQAATEAGVERFVHASTGSVYGEPVAFPQTESHPLRPVSYYGVSKHHGPAVLPRIRTTPGKQRSRGSRVDLPPPRSARPALGDPR
jgi:nucleoside-diphosphate-sugar epimerase